MPTLIKLEHNIRVGYWAGRILMMTIGAWIVAVAIMGISN
jgi:hypothetical protein